MKTTVNAALVVTVDGKAGEPRNFSGLDSSSLRQLQRALMSALQEFDKAADNPRGPVNAGPNTHSAEFDLQVTNDGDGSLFTSCNFKWPNLTAGELAFMQGVFSGVLDGG